MTDTAPETASEKSAPDETLPEALGARRIATLLEQRLGVPVATDDVEPGSRSAVSSGT